MKENLKSFGSVVLVLALFLFTLWANLVQIKQREANIYNWLKQHQITNVTVERCIYNRGPYCWRDADDYDVYYAEGQDNMERRKKIYFCFGPFGDFEWSMQD